MKLPTGGVVMKLPKQARFRREEEIFSTGTAEFTAHLYKCLKPWHKGLSGNFNI